jgi:adenosine deaminase
MGCTVEPESDHSEMLTFIKGLPKTELHVHIEGTLEPATMLAMAKKNDMLESILNEGETVE